MRRYCKLLQATVWNIKISYTVPIRLLLFQFLRAFLLYRIITFTRDCDNRIGIVIIARSTKLNESRIKQKRIIEAKYVSWRFGARRCIVAVHNKISYTRCSPLRKVGTDSIKFNSGCMKIISHVAILNDWHQRAQRTFPRKRRWYQNLWTAASYKSPSIVRIIKQRSASRRWHMWRCRESR